MSKPHAEFIKLEWQEKGVLRSLPDTEEPQLSYTIKGHISNLIHLDLLLKALLYAKSDLLYSSL